MTYSEWYEKHWGDVSDTTADRTFGETVWEDARRDLREEQDPTKEIEASRRPVANCYGT